jgi:predicted Ser/Thr protein kinase
MASSYLDFDLLIEQGEESCQARVLNSPAGSAEQEFRLPFDARDLESFFLRIKGMGQRVRRIDSPEMAQIKQFGGTLFDLVFDGQVLACLGRSLDAAKGAAGIRIRLRTQDRSESASVPLSALPWEFLYDRSSNAFLTLSDRSPLVRYPELALPVEPLEVTPPLRILAMVSSPGGFPDLDVDREWEKIEEAMAELRDRDLAVVHRLEPPTLKALQRQLLRAGPYHIFHFVGHGRFNERTEDGELLLETLEGKAERVGGELIKVMLARHSSLRLVVLNACEGARASAEDPFSGTAQTLVQGGVPAVIAMQQEITDRAAIEFSEEFYAALAYGYPVDRAVIEGRIAVYTRVSSVEWAIPVLYMRSPDGRIFNLAEAERLNSEWLARKEAERVEGEQLKGNQLAREPAQRRGHGMMPEGTRRTGVQLLGRYEVEERLGEGSVATVFRGRDRVLDRTVAVLVLLPGLAKDASYGERFQREARVAASLNHPNIVSVFDFGAEGDLHYFVTEYIHGRNLKSLLHEEGQLQPDRAVEIAKSVCAALSFAHRHGIVHRDIDPSNIMITLSGEVKVMGFGVARRTASESLTQTATVPGTAAYFSPEQTQGNPVDTRSDIYSLGVVLYEMLTGQVPFTGDSLTIAYKHVREEPVPPSKIAPWMPPNLDAVVMKALAKTPAERFQTAEELSYALG